MVEKVTTVFDLEQRAADRSIELAAGDEQRVAHRFGFEPPQARATEHAVFRVTSDRFGTRCAALLVSAGGENQPVQGLERPTVADESAGEPVEQFRMRRALAEQTEVVGRAHDSGT